MSVGSRIKELRESKGLSRGELANLLGITVGSISNYENEVSSPKEPILFKIMTVLNCDANYLFQDALDMPSMKNSVSVNEYEVIKKYRDLDDHGTDMVDTVLSKEWERSKAEKEKEQAQQTSQPVPVSIAAETEPEHLRVQAAHAIEGASEEDNQHDDDLMNNDDLWK